MATRSKCGVPTLPMSRVRTIMRSSPEVSSISPDAIALTSHSAQLFISQLVRDAFDLTKGQSVNKLEYKHLSQVVATNPRMSFLQDILPEKIKVKDYRLMAETIREQNIKEILSENNPISDNSDEEVIQKE